jgi:hypothetical protein
MARIRNLAREHAAEFGAEATAAEARWLTFIGLAAPFALLGIAIILEAVSC